MFPLPHLLLQMKYQGFGQTPTNKSTTYIILGAILGIIIVVAIVSGLVSKNKKEGKRGKLSKRSFRKECRKAGMPDKHISVFYSLVKANDVSNPYALLGNNRQLDNLLHQAIASIENEETSEEVKEAKKLGIYQIKQIIERHAKGNQGNLSTRQIRPGQSLVISPESGGRFPSKVSGNTKDSLQVHAPVTADGKLIIFKRWTRIKVQFWKESGEMYTFTTKVITTQNKRGLPVLLLQHSKNIEVAQQRRFRRKQVDKPAFFSLVSVVVTGHGKNRRKRAVVNQKQNSLGTMIDISSGGCSIKTNVPLKKGDLIRIQFEPVRKNTVIAFGKVLMLRKMRPVGSVMHIQFTRLSRKYLNKINEYVYDDLSWEEM